MKAILMGIDLGTTGMKVSLIDEESSILSSAYREYGISVPKPGYAEQDPQAWWKALIDCTRELQEKARPSFGCIEGIGICGQMHTQVYLDKEDSILRPAITWMDQRSKELVDQISKDTEKAELIFKETANSIATTYTAPNCLWVQKHEKELWRKVASVMVAKDYIKYLLTGEKSTDYSDASGTLLFDVAARKWSETMERLFGIPANYIPQAVPSAIIMGRVTQEAAALTGLTEGIPVVNGASDNSASALGSGMLNPGQATLIIGTAGVVSLCSDRPLPDPRHRVLCWNYCLPNRWINLGVTQTAGESLNWFKDCFDGDGNMGESGDIFQRYDQELTETPDGSGGLIFLPYLNGERTPYWDSNARGVFFGVNLGTKKTHFIKAVMEGVSFALRNNIETVESLGLPVNEIRAVGGGLKSPVWLSCLAHILGRPIRTIPISDTGNRGNVLICGKAIGLFDSIEGAMKPMENETMSQDTMEIYERQYRLFLRLYDDLKETFKLV